MRWREWKWIESHSIQFLGEGYTCSPEFSAKVGRGSRGSSEEIRAEGCLRR